MASNCPEFNYCCEICGQEGFSEDEFRIHTRNAHVEGFGVCPFCDLTAANPAELIIHVNQAHLDFLSPESEHTISFIDDPSPRTPSDCNGFNGESSVTWNNPATYSSNRSLNGEKVDNKSSYSNINLSPKVNGGGELTPKNSSHGEGSPLRSSLALKLKSASPALQCPMCNYTTGSSSDIEEHVNRRHFDLTSPSVGSIGTEECYTCPLCVKSFVSAPDLELHVNIEHKDVLSPAPASPSFYNCPVCGMALDTESDSKAVQQHVDSHFSAGSPQPSDRAALRERERKEFEMLRAQYGMDNQVGNFREQSVANMQQAVYAGEMSVADYYERQLDLKAAESSGVDDGSSVTRSMGNSQEHWVNNMQRAVYAGKMSVADFYQRQLDLKAAESSLVDKGSSVTRSTSNSREQWLNNMRRAVYAGEMSVADFYKRQLDLIATGSSMVDDGSSVTRSMGNFREQWVTNMQREVYEGKLSVADFYERQLDLKAAESSVVDNGSSVTKSTSNFREQWVTNMQREVYEGKLSVADFYERQLDLKAAESSVVEDNGSSVTRSTSNSREQWLNNMQREVYAGELSVADFYKRQLDLLATGSSGVHDGSSVTISMDNFQEQSVTNMQRAVYAGEMSVADYYERKLDLLTAKSSGLDDGSSVTRSMVPRVKAMSTNSPIVTRTLLCTCVDHYASSYGDRGWGCGYRNTQMIISSLLTHTGYNERLYKLWQKEKPPRSSVPSISRLQSLIEQAWSQGFDIQGSEQLGCRLVNTRKWIGATEVVTLLAFLRIRCQLVDFHRPTGPGGSHPELFKWVLNYFESSVGGEFTAPLYLQHQGHSRTIMGIEVHRDGSLVLLVLDPSHSPQQVAQLGDTSTTSGALRLLRKSEAAMKARQYQIVGVVGTIDNEQQYQNSKILRGTRVPQER